MNNNPTVSDTFSMAQQEKQLHDQPLYAPLSSAALFWRPRHLAPSPMAAQIPLLFWMMDIVRPRSIVQVGLGDGVIYMALCQAIEKLGAHAAIVGLEICSSSATLPLAFQTPHDADYTDFSSLEAIPLAQAAERFAEDLDMLVLNAPLDQGNAQDLLEKWLPALSDSAVIIICQPHSVFQQEGLSREMVFKSDLISLSGPLSVGRGELDVILHGHRQPERLLKLGSRNADIATRVIARQVFGRLGQGIMDNLDLEAMRRQNYDQVMENEHAKHEVSSLRLELEVTEEALNQVQEQAKSSQTQLDNIKQANSMDIARCVQQRAVINELRVQLDDTRLKYRSISQQYDRLRDIEVQLKEQLNDVQLKYRQVCQQLSDTRDMQTRRTSDMKQELISSNHALKHALKETKALSLKIKMINNSTSWRITKPLRGIKRIFSRLKKAE